jgi:hypothetical protein
MSRDFYDLCYDQYKHEMSEAEGLYQKVGVILLVLPLLGTIMVALGRVDILHLGFMQVDVFLYYFASLVAVLALAASVVFLFYCVYPRQYKNIANMDVWHKWREDYQKHLSAHGEHATGELASIDAAMLANLCLRLAEAQPVNAEINEKRRKAFKRSVQMAAIALAAIGVQALFCLALKLQGV